MVASSRMCRRFVRRRDKVTLAMQDLRSLGGFWLRRLTGGRQLRQTGAGRKTPLAAKKRRQTRGLFTYGYILTIPACSLTVGAKLPFHRLRWPASSRQPGE